MPLDEWQRELRRQFGREQKFQLRNSGERPVFSEFVVTNPQSQRAYTVAVRGTQPGANYCSCADFATNALGTCKHIEFTLAILEKRRGGKRALRDGFVPPYSEVYLEYGAQRRIRFKPGTECPGELSALAARFFDGDGVLTADGTAQFDEFQRQTAGIDHELRCYDDAAQFIAGLRDDAERRRKIDDLFRAGTRSARFRTLLKTQLYDYQREGALFAARAGRAILGDEMGLGKTIQALATAEILAETCGVERALIICPTSLKHQWEREIEKFTQRDAVVVGGLQRTRAERYRQPAFFHIVNYDTIHRDLDLIRDLEPEFVILDEAQRIKNWETRAARSVKQIESPYCLVLTGTPIENRLEELVSIVQFVDLHRLGPTYRFLHDHQVREEGTTRVVGYKDLDRIGRTLEPILLRRRKDEVLDQLPERIDNNVLVPMTPQQLNYHEDNRETVARLVFKWRKYGYLSEADQLRLRIALQNMRMSCNSTYLLDHETDFSYKPDELVTLLDELFERPDAKVVVFSQWTRTHELVIRRLDRRPWEHVFFHGGVDSHDRRGLIDRFREDADCRVFLSTDAGGVGLNLQHASIVVNMDLPWNPAVLEQRIGRVHRLGQKQPVRVVNFIAQNTIEDVMRGVLSFKKGLFEGVLDGGAKEVYRGKTGLAKFMEAVESVSAALPARSESDPEPVGEGDGLEEPPPAGGDAAPAREIPAPVSPAPAADPWHDLLAVGTQLLQQLTAERGPGAGRSGTARLPVERDPDTGREYFRVPLPDRDALETLARAASAVLERLRS
jgi:superfamily II DNA or RNA helicase